MISKFIQSHLDAMLTLLETVAVALLWVIDQKEMAVIFAVLWIGIANYWWVKSLRMLDQYRAIADGQVREIQNLRNKLGER